MHHEVVVDIPYKPSSVFLRHERVINSKNKRYYVEVSFSSFMAKSVLFLDCSIQLLQPEKVQSYLKNI